MDAVDFTECRDCACLSARRTAARLTRLYDEKLRPHGLSINQFSLLTTLILAGPTTISTLADLLGIERTTLTRNLGLALGKSLVQIRPGKDARERIVSVTRLGREAAAAALPAWRQAQAEASA
ncbi:MarR family winged helix-turn-helix transcriptional regulator [Devosia nitrariae]|uniref:Transcriptional regulator n=1 Tax=Devosia nitrariae TaxID=2071872 RepID=A0ABQ5VYV0_9HYPH|nr:MarR family transcriptional regulator [Devosia nitrariae]GLQ52788.1 transcriptional regulator [Devosia nitrariae]